MQGRRWAKPVVVLFSLFVDWFSQLSTLSGSIFSRSSAVSVGIFSFSFESDVDCGFFLLHDLVQSLRHRVENGF